MGILCLTCVMFFRNLTLVLNETCLSLITEATNPVTLLYTVYSRI